MKALKPFCVSEVCNEIKEYGVVINPINKPNDDEMTTRERYDKHAQDFAWELLRSNTRDLVWHQLLV